MSDARTISSPLLPGGDLVSAVLSRELMILADRGGASALVGSRWADLCATWASGWTGVACPVPDTLDDPLIVDRVVRLDDAPAVAATASKRGLQNPDLLLIGQRAGRTTIQAADAKFSVETARSKQVSPTVVDALLGLGPAIDSLVGVVDSPLDLVPGIFLSPDFHLTHLMLRRRHGIVRTTVKVDEVVMVPVASRTFFAPLEGVTIMPVLADVDGLPVDIGIDLLAGLYYFRLARAVIGCWLDEVRPLLLFNDKIAVDEAAVREKAARRATESRSAFALARTWNGDVDRVRAARTAVDQVTGLPWTSKDLRALIVRAGGNLEAGVPSVNQVRRRLGAWFRGEIRERAGPILPPVADLPSVLQGLALISASLSPRLETEGRRIVQELIVAQETAALSDEVAT